MPLLFAEVVPQTVQQSHTSSNPSLQHHGQRCTVSTQRTGGGGGGSHVPLCLGPHNRLPCSPFSHLTPIHICLCQKQGLRLSETVGHDPLTLVWRAGHRDASAAEVYKTSECLAEEHKSSRRPVLCCVLCALCAIPWLPVSLPHSRLCQAFLCVIDATESSATAHETPAVRCYQEAQQARKRRHEVQPQVR